MEQYKTVKISQKSPDSGVFHLLLNRPSQLNTLTFDFFTEFPAALDSLDQNPDARVIILFAADNHFCVGIDLNTFTSLTSQSGSTTDRGRASEKLRRDIKLLQDAVTAIERCRKPVIAAIHGGCIGGGIDIVTACDMRFCVKDAFFSVKEVDLGLTADLGTLQRLPRIVGYGVAMDLALTGRRISGQEAKGICLVSRVFESKEDLEKGVSDVAESELLYPFLHVSSCLQFYFVVAIRLKMFLLHPSCVRKENTSKLNPAARPDPRRNNSGQIRLRGTARQ